MIRLTDQEFETMTVYIRENYGINLEKKRHLIEARMYSVLTQKNLTSFTDYFSLVRHDSQEAAAMLNKLTTNHTYFMRERAHFDYLTGVILPEQEKTNRQKELRIWSAGCSTGEEAYTAILFMTEYFGTRRFEWDYSILATDISLKVLEAAPNPVYPGEALKDVPPAWRRKYFTAAPDGCYTLNREVREQVTFRRLNLMEPFVFKKPFDLIFCRNVMIYFDQPTKTRLANKFYDVLKPGGYLFIGHSESLQRDASRFRYLQPSIYQKG